jgi:hypothetical protein
MRHGVDLDRGFPPAGGIHLLPHIGLLMMHTHEFFAAEPWWYCAYQIPGRVFVERGTHSISFPQGWTFTCTRQNAVCSICGEGDSCM